MKFDIVGTGSIGLLFAVKLLLANYDVQLWSRTEEQAKLLEEQGIVFQSLGGGSKSLLKLTCKAIGSEAAEKDELREAADSRYMMLAVKQHHLNEHLLHELDKLARSGRYEAVIAMQNGVGHIAKLGSFLQMPVLTAVTSEAAKRLDQAIIAHAGQGKTWIGDELGRDRDNKHQKNIEEALQKAGFTAFMSKNIKEQVYYKLIGNAVINPLTALFNVSNGELPQSTTRRRLMEKLFAETKQVLLIEEPTIAAYRFEHILQLCSATADNTSSMRADILRGAETEVAYINGAVSAIAARHKLQAPLNESLVHMIEALHPDQKE